MKLLNELKSIAVGLAFFTVTIGIGLTLAYVTPKYTFPVLLVLVCAWMVGTGLRELRS